MIENGGIGRSEYARISRVPQSRESTQLAGAIMASALRLIGEGSDVQPMRSVSIRETLMMTDVEKRRQSLNTKLFGRPWIM